MSVVWSEIFPDSNELPDKSVKLYVAFSSGANSDVNFIEITSVTNVGVTEIELESLTSATLDLDDCSCRDVHPPSGL